MKVAPVPWKCRKLWEPELLTPSEAYKPPCFTELLQACIENEKPNIELKLPHNNLEHKNSLLCHIISL